MTRLFLSNIYIYLFEIKLYIFELYKLTKQINYITRLFYIIFLKKSLAVLNQQL